MGKTLFMETTTITAERSVEHITRLLASVRVTSLLLEYDQVGNVVGLSFRLQVTPSGWTIPFRLPCRWEAVKAKLLAEKRKPRGKISMDVWARQIAWRQMFHWLQAQIAIVATGMVQIEEVMLPYAQIGADGTTVYESVKQAKFQALTDK